MKHYPVLSTAAALVLLLGLTGCAADPSMTVDADPTADAYTVDIQVPYVTNAPTEVPDPEDNILDDDSYISISSDGKVTILKDSWADYEVETQIKSETQMQAQTGTLLPTDLIQLRPGDTGSEVEDLQKRLTELGYYAGPVNGIFDTTTESAFLAFEAQYSNVCYGIASVKLQKYLYSEDAKISPDGPVASGTVEIASEGTAEPEPQETIVPVVTEEPLIVIEPTAAPSVEAAEATIEPDTVLPLATAESLDGAFAATFEVPDSYDKLEYGDSNDNVRILQTRLKQLGYLCGDVTGTYDYYTVAAVLRFEAAYGRKYSGIATKSMQEYLYQENAITLGSEKDEAKENGQFIAITKRKSGADVLWLQKRLVKLGYSSATPNGKYNAYTRKLLKQFQKNMGLEATGEATAETLQALYGPNAARAK